MFVTCFNSKLLKPLLVLNKIEKNSLNLNLHFRKYHEWPTLKSSLISGFNLRRLHILEFSKLGQSNSGHFWWNCVGFGIFAFWLAKSFDRPRILFLIGLFYWSNLWPDFGFRKGFPRFRLHFWTKYLRLIFKLNFHVLFSHAYTFEKSNLNEHFVDVFEIDWNIGWNTFQVLFRVMFGLTVIWFVSDPSVFLIKNPRSTAVIGF